MTPDRKKVMEKGNVTYYGTQEAVDHLGYPQKGGSWMSGWLAGGWWLVVG